MKLSPLSLSMLQIYGLAVFYFTANSILTVIIPLQASAHGIGEMEIGLLMGVYMFVCMILRPWAGQMIAKYSVATIMKWLLIVHSSALLLYVWLGVDSLYAVRILQGIITAFFSMAMQIAVTEVLHDEDRAQGMSMYSLSTVLPGLYGPALAMALWIPQDMKWLLLCITILAFLPLLCSIHAPLPKSKKDNTSFTFKDMLGAIKITKKNKGLLISSIVMLIGASIFGGLSAFLPLFLVTKGAGNAAFYLFLQAIVVVGSRFFFRKYIPSDGKWHPSFIGFVLGSSIIGTSLLALLPEVSAMVYLSAVFNGVAMAMLYPTLTTYISFVIPDNNRFLLLGIFLASYDLGFSMGGLLMGVVVQFFSYQVMFAVCTILGFIALIYNYTASRTN